MCHFFGISVQSKNRDYSGFVKVILEGKARNIRLNMTSLMMTSSQYSKNVIQNSPLHYMLNWTFSTWSTTIMWYFIVCVPFCCLFSVEFGTPRLICIMGKCTIFHVRFNFLLYVAICSNRLKIIEWQNLPQ